MSSETPDRGAHCAPLPGGRADVGIGPYGQDVEDAGAKDIYVRSKRCAGAPGGPLRSAAPTGAEHGAAGTAVAGMRRIRSDAELPREVLDYIEIVESDNPRSCKDQLALAAYVRKAFNTEEIYMDLERLENYLSLQKYFPFNLFPWQKFLLALWLCSFDPEGFPRWDTLAAMLARGGGKDGFIAFSAFCLTSPYNPVSSYDVDICGNDEVQATRPLKDLIRVLEKPKQSAKLNRFWHHTKESADGLKNGGTVRGWANNAKNRDGLRSGVIIFNEVHQYVSFDNVSVFTSGLGKTPEPRTGIFTSNGKVNDGPLDTWLQQGDRILYEGEKDHGLLPFICRLEKEEQVRDPANWPMANPSWAYLPTLRRETEREYYGWLTEPERHGDFLAKRMGIRKGFTELAVTDYEKILATKRPLPPPEEMKGWTCVAGLDYAELNDWAAAVLLFRRAAERIVLCHTWICAESKTLPRVRVPWADWVSAGHCTLVHEPTISPELLGAWLQNAGKIYNIKKLAMDSYRWTLVSDAMIKAGFDVRDKKNKVKLIRPSDIMKTEPLIASIFDRGLYVWGDNPPLRWATNNTKRIPASRGIGADTGNFYYGKIEAKSRKTDPFMALVAAECIENELPQNSGPLRPPPPPIVWR